MPRQSTGAGFCSASRNLTGTAAILRPDRRENRRRRQTERAGLEPSTHVHPTTVIFQESDGCGSLECLDAGSFLEWLTKNEKRIRQNRCVSWRSAGGRRRYGMQMHGGAGDKAKPRKVSECCLYQPQDRLRGAIAARWDVSAGCPWQNLQGPTRRWQMAACEALRLRLH